MNALDELFGESRNAGKVRFKVWKEDPVFRGFSEKRSSKKIAASIVNFSTEVVVKVSGYTKSGNGAQGKGAGPVSSHIKYISRHGQVEIETNTGELISGKAGIKEFCADWQNSIDAARTSEKSRDVMHLVLSMHGRQDVEKMRESIRDFAATTFGNNYEYAFVLHTDTENTHGHLAVKCRGFDGKQMQMGPGVAQEWRTVFAASLRSHGIYAEATPRHYRGVLRKAEPQAFRHMERPQEESGRKPRIPEVRKQQIQEIMVDLNKLNKGEKITNNIFAENAKNHVVKVKQTWLKAAKELEISSDSIEEKENKKLANQIYKFVESMPELKTQRELMQEKMLRLGVGLVMKKEKESHKILKEQEPEL